MKKRLDVSSESPAILIFYFYLSKKIRLHVLESFARQRIHLKHQALFSSKDKSKKKKLKCCLLQFLFDALRVNSHKCNIHL